MRFANGTIFAMVTFLCLCTSQVLAQTCHDLFRDEASAYATADQDVKMITQQIDQLKPALETLVGNRWGGLYGPNCFKASKILLGLIQEKFNAKNVIMVGTTVYSSDHYLLMMPNYFGYGQHLYIDPTILQFVRGDQQLGNPIFVGSESDLKAFSKTVLHTTSSFVTNYLKLKNPPASPLQQFVNSAPE